MYQLILLNKTPHKVLFLENYTYILKQSQILKMWFMFKPSEENIAITQ